MLSFLLSASVPMSEVTDTVTQVIPLTKYTTAVIIDMAKVTFHFLLIVLHIFLSQLEYHDNAYRWLVG